MMKDQATALNQTAAQDTHTYRFVKEENSWFLFSPACRRDASLMKELKEGARSLLNTLARGRREMYIRLDTEPFEGAETLELIELCEAPRGGAYYFMTTCNGRKVSKTMWLCDLTLVLFGDMPEGVYFRMIPEALYQ